MLDKPKNGSPLEKSTSLLVPDPDSQDSLPPKKNVNGDNVDYQRGMFIDTTCSKAEIHSYGDMYDLLKKLETPSDVKLYSIGKSEGYGGPDNALDIWALIMPATEKAEKTAFFVAGHHPEPSGPEAVYLIAERLLGSYHSDNKNVKTLRRNTDLVFIPHADPDLYNNLKKYVDKESYFENGYLWRVSKPFEKISIRYHESNSYIFPGSVSEEEYVRKMGKPFAQAEAIKEYVNNSIASSRPPILSIDYHENYKLPTFEIMQRGKGIPMDIWKEVGKDYPISDDFFKRYKEMEISRANNATARSTFADMLNMAGATSYLIEASAEKRYTLENSIEMHLIATDAILAKHCSAF